MLIIQVVQVLKCKHHGEERDFGWASHSYPQPIVAENFEKAYKDVWLKDERVMAVTPFTIRYDPPFDHFSWVNKDNVPYLHYQVVKSMKKVAGAPPKLMKAKLQIPC